MSIAAAFAMGFVVGLTSGWAYSASLITRQADEIWWLRRTIRQLRQRRKAEFSQN